MNEAEWLASDDPAAMLAYLRTGRLDESMGANYPLQPCRINPSDRKLRLFACACCDNIAEYDEKGGKWDTAVSLNRMMAESCRCCRPKKEQAALLRCIFGNPFRPVRLPMVSEAVLRREGSSDTATDMVRYFPWLTWNDGIVPRLAEACYAERTSEGLLDAGRLAILCDALEEAGCTDQQILDHGRGPGPHVRGCWLVDLLLGKS